MKNSNQNKPDQPEDQIRQLQRENNRLQRIIKRHETQLQHLDKMASANEKTNIALYKELEVLQQQAEAQAREAQIEAALERVRARTMGMHKSEELAEVVKLLYKETEPFGISTFGISIAIFREEEDAVEYWFADNLDSNLLQSYKVAGQKNKVFRQIWEEWKKKSPQIKVYMEGDEKRDYDTFILEETEFSKLPEELKQEIRTHKTVCFTFTFFEYGYFESVDLTIPDEENAKLIIRFAKVFEQTYTRFLDLQKAEAQAREAQIEAALERVRASTMAMHKSEALGTVIFTLFQQLTGLGIKIVSSWVTLMHSEQNELEIWVTNTMGEAKPTFVKTTEYETFEKEMQAWRAGQDISLAIPSGIAHGIVKKLFNIDINPPADKPFWHLIQSWHRFGYIGLSTWEPATDEENNIIGRFSRVFEQAYTRFLDIKKAESQAREAQIEAALERVRTRVVAMRHSDELSEAAELLYQEFLKFGVASFSCGYLINDDEKAEWRIWLTNPGERFFKEFWTAPYAADHNLRARYESWKRREAFHCAVLEGEENRAHHVVISQYAPWKAEMLDALPPAWFLTAPIFHWGIYWSFHRKGLPLNWSRQWCDLRVFSIWLTAVFSTCKKRKPAPSKPPAPPPSTACAPKSPPCAARTIYSASPRSSGAS